jgi:hypothetical protein
MSKKIQANHMTLSTKMTARIGGLLYLIIIITGIFGELLIRGKIIVSGDAAATAHNIMSSQLLWRIGIAGDLLMHICDIPLILVFYILFRPVNKDLALLVVFFNLVSTSVLVATKLNLVTALFPLGSADYLKTFEPGQLETMTYLAIRADGFGFGIGLIFFAFVCLLLGYLIRKSDLVPKAIGVLMQIAGVCYLVNSFALIIDPAFANTIFPYILVPSFIGETSLCLWLLIKGVKTATPSSA